MRITRSTAVSHSSVKQNTHGMADERDIEMSLSFQPRVCFGPRFDGLTKPALIKTLFGGGYGVKNLSRRFIPTSLGRRNVERAP